MGRVSTLQHAPSASLPRRIGATLEMIKWEHSIFALPFALTAAFLAASGWPPLLKLLWIVICMVLARSAAMAFNRWADAELDALNPRTRMRAIPAGHLSRAFVGWFTLVTSALFLLAAAQLNRLTLLLAPLVLAVLLLYSYTKRFTRWSHLVLGLALGLAPGGAWVAVRGTLDLRILVLTLLVLRTPSTTVLPGSRACLRPLGSPAPSGWRVCCIWRCWRFPSGSSTCLVWGLWRGSASPSSPLSCSTSTPSSRPPI